MTSSEGTGEHQARALGQVDFSGVDELFADFQRSAEGPPGVAYGIVHLGKVIHGGGYGTTSIDRLSTPDIDTVFRIASLSKSFTAAAILSLRDEGLLRLDDPVGLHVPSLAGAPGASLDSPQMTIADCLTMSAGLPSDDAWGDRQESMTRAQLDDLFIGGLRLAHSPGTHFEYSNLGFAILGRIVANTSGRAFTDLVAARLMEPLGLESTTYDYRAVSSERLANGHRKAPDGWRTQPFTAPGEFSAIGGILSTVRDLAVWIDSFAEAFPARDSPEGAQPLRRSTRREMQQQHRAIPAELVVGPGGDPQVRSVGFPWGLGGYGYGLFVEQDLQWGEMVHHLGGYPGFGSHMRWHRETGIGVVAFGNATYSPVAEPAARALRLVLQQIDAPARTVRLWPELTAARALVERLLVGEDDALRHTMFSPNVLADVPADERLRALHDVRDRVGEIDAEGVGPVESTSPGHLIWSQRATRGRVRIELTLTPTRPTMIQTLDISGVQDAQHIGPTPGRSRVRVIGSHESLG